MPRVSIEAGQPLSGLAIASESDGIDGLVQLGEGLVLLLDPSRSRAKQVE